MFTAMRFEDQQLKLIDQRRLPHEEKWIVARDLATVAEAIEQMSVRGAPAIATAAAFALVLDAQAASFQQWLDYAGPFFKNCERLEATRPTAVNLKHAMAQIRQVVRSWPNETTKAGVVEALLKFAFELEAADLRTCQAIGAHGLTLGQGRPLKILTHCNTGSLATAGYGTALGVIRALHAQGWVQKVYVDETRPYLQGSRLTAYELEAEGIPYSIQTDSAAAFVLQRESIDFVVVGADRIVANGDTANKIGTYSLAIVAQFHKVPFYVAAPCSSFDGSIPQGDGIPIEMRNAQEIKELAGVAIAPKNAQTMNPSFDVTPHSLISGFITEWGMVLPPFGPGIKKLLAR